MATKTKSPQKSLNTDLPGTIYLNKNRYWWKVQLPGEEKITPRPLKIVGAKFATKDPSVALQCAKNLYEQALYQNQNTVRSDIHTLGQLVHAYLQFAREYYVDAEGRHTREPVDIKYALKPLTDRFATLPIEEFGPLRLKEVREDMIARNWCRKLINRRVGIIRRMFKWAVSEQIASPIILHGLQAVTGLKRGRCKAKENPKRKPVDERYVQAVLPYMTPVVAAMVEIQLLTGMRPGEVCLMRPCDLNRSGAVWHYFPERHKNVYREIERIVSIGPRGQEILRPFLLRAAENYCFSPAESERQRREKLTQNRKTPLSCGNKVGTNRKSDPGKLPGEVYDSHAYAKAVKYAIAAANRVIKRKAKEEGNDHPELIPHWTPYQLRHTAGTKVRNAMGLETAGAALGHTKMSATEIYAQRNQGLADEAALRFG